MKVLVIDDDPLIRNGCRRILERGGFSCTTAEGGAQAFEYVRRASFDAALVDLGMPGMSGMEILRKLREESPGTAVVIITDRVSIDSVIETVKAGAFDYLPKPFTPEVLTARVRRAITSTRKAMEESCIRQELEREKLSQTMQRMPTMGRVARLIQGVAPVVDGTAADGDGGNSGDGGDDAQGSLARMEATEIQSALRQFQGNKTKSAAHLGINRKTLREKMQKYGIVYAKLDKAEREIAEGRVLDARESLRALRRKHGI